MQAVVVEGSVVRFATELHDEMRYTDQVKAAKHREWSLGKDGNHIGVVMAPVGYKPL